MKKRKAVRIIALVLAMLMPISTASLFVFAENNSVSVSDNSVFTEKYQKPDVNKLTGHGAEPEEISVSAGATYQEKAWYEYVVYSDHAVASYRVDDDHRLLFYDPYTYTNAMVMDVQFDATTKDFDTMSEYTVSNTTSKTISACAESTYTNTSALQTSGRDEYGTKTVNGGSTHTKYNYDEIHKTEGTVKEDTEYIYKKREYVTISDTIESQINSSIEAGTEIGLDAKVTANASNGVSETHSTTTDHHIEWFLDKETNTTEYNGYKTTITHDYEYDVEDNTTSTTEGWEQLAARVTKTVGSSSSTSTMWSEEESITVTKKYAATHFASDGVTPLPWAIVHYSVQMPMKCSLQVKYSGEWITISTVYCLLTTIKGTCRAWIQNGQVYYEDWGSGEPVVEANLWSQFMTKEQLMRAYNSKLYPTGGED